MSCFGIERFYQHSLIRGGWGGCYTFSDFPHVNLNVCVFPVFENKIIQTISIVVFTMGDDRIMYRKPCIVRRTL